MVKIGGREIRRVSVVDDDTKFRTSLAETIEEAELEAIQEAGPLENLQTFVAATAKTVDAAVFDHNLRQQKYYATFNGVEAVAQLYKKKIPAVLCTRWDRANIEEIRSYRRFVPVLLKPSEIEPEAVIRAFGYCIDEFKGKFRQNRKPTRALVRIEEISERHAYLVVPAFASDDVIRVMKTDLPEPIQNAFAKGKLRFHAQVNLGAESDDQLFFESWESS